MDFICSSALYLSPFTFSRGCLAPLEPYLCVGNCLHHGSYLPQAEKKTTLTSQSALQVCAGRCPISHWVYMRHALQCEQRALWNPFCFRVWELQTTQDLPPEQRWQCMLVTGGTTKSWQLLKVDTSSLVST